MIREMDRSEIPVCVQVIRESFLTVAEEFGFTRENAPRFIAFAVDEQRLYWHHDGEHRPMCVYTDNGRIVGYYSLLPQGECCELNNICVLPEYRHRDIGAKLLADAAHRAKSLGCGKLTIGIVEENTRLRKWYEKYGFVHTGTKKFDFFPFTCGYMEREI